MEKTNCIISSIACIVSQKTNYGKSKNDSTRLKRTNFKAKISCVIILLGFLVSPIKMFSQSYLPWLSDTTKIYRTVFNKSMHYLDSIHSIDTVRYSKEARQFDIWHYFNVSRLSGPDGKYGLYNQYLVDRIFSNYDSTSSVTAMDFVSTNCNPDINCTENCFGRGKWNNLGPENIYVPDPNDYTDIASHVGVTTKIEMSPFGNPNRIYLGSVAGGLFKTVDGGKNWDPLEFINSDGNSAGTIGVSDIVVWHNKNTANDIVVTSTGYNWHRNSFSTVKGASFYGLGVVRSMNGGATWEKTDLTFSANDGLYVKRLVKDINNSSGIIYAIVVQEKISDPVISIHKSSDFGKTWVDLKIRIFDEYNKLITDNNLIYLQPHPTNSSIFYLVSQTRVYVSYNSCSTWKTIYTFPNIINDNESAVTLTTLENKLIAGAEDNLYLFYNYDANCTLVKFTDKGNKNSIVFNGNIRVGNQGEYTPNSKIWLAVSQFSSDHQETYYFGGIYIRKLSWDINNKKYVLSFVTSSNYLSIHADVRYMKLKKSDSEDTLLVCTDGGASIIYDARGIKNSSYIPQHIQNLQGNGLSISTLLDLDVSKDGKNVITGMQDNGFKLLKEPVLGNDKYNWTAFEGNIMTFDVGKVAYDENGYYYCVGNSGFTTNNPSYNSDPNSVPFFPDGNGWRTQPLIAKNGFLYYQENDNFKGLTLVAIDLSNFNNRYSLTDKNNNNRRINQIDDVEIGSVNSDIIYYSLYEPRNSQPLTGSYSTTNSNDYGQRLFVSEKGINSQESDWREISVCFDASDNHPNLNNDIRSIDHVGVITDIELNSHDDKEVFVSIGGFTDDKVFHTKDALAKNSNGHGSVVWESLPTNCLPPGPINCIKHWYRSGGKDDMGNDIETSVLFAGTDAGVYYLVIGEECWKPMNKDIPQCIIADIVIDEKYNRLYIATYGRGVWYSALPCIGCTPVQNFFTLTSNFTIQSNTYFDRSIRVSSGTTLTVKNCDLHMPARAEIIVEAGGELVIDNARITNTCWRNWGGIDVKGDGPSNLQTDANSGTVRMFNGTIENASDAMEIFSGGRIFAQNSHFRNNAIGITFYPYFGTQDYQHLLENVNFTNDDTLNNSVGTSVHVIIHDNKINMTNCSFENSIPQQTKLLANGRGVGILIFNGALKMWPKLLTSPNNRPCEVIGVDVRPYFKNLDVGVEWHNNMEVNPINNRQNFVIINDHDFVNCGRGLISINSKNDQFFGNKFKYDSNIKFWVNPGFNNSSLTTSFIAGAFFNQSHGFSFYNNTFERHYDAIAGNNYLDTIYDVYLVNTSMGNPLSVVSKFQDNQFSNPVYFSNYWNIGIYLCGVNKELSLQRNNFNNKALSYLFLGGYPNPGSVNRTVEAIAGCDGNNTHSCYNSIPSRPILGERIPSINPLSFEIWNTSRYNVSNPCLNLSANGSKYIISSSLFCSQSQLKTMADAYCPSVGNLGNEFVSLSRDFKECHYNDQNLELANKLIGNGFDLSLLTNAETDLLDSLIRSGCLSPTLKEILTFSEKNSVVNTYGNLGEFADELQNSYQLFPNPTNAEFKIKYQFAGHVNAQILVYSLDGKLQTKANLDQESDIKTISTIDLNSGLYSVVIIADDKVIGRETLIVLH